MHIMSAASEAELSRFEDELRSREKSPATLDGYLSDVRLFAVWEHERHPNAGLNDMGEVDIRAYRDWLLDIERRRASTVNRRLQALRAFYRGEMRAGRRKNNPAAEVHTVREATRTRPLSLRDDEVHRLLTAAGRSAQSTRNLALVHMMLQAGLRVAEVHHLHWADLTLSERAGQVQIHGKGLRQRVVPLNARCRRAIARYLEQASPDSPSTRVFVSNRGRPMARRTIQYTIARLAKVANIDRLAVGPHTLRHTFAANYLDANPGGLVQLSGLLGHESLETTAVYLRPSMAELEAGVERAAR